MYKTQLPLDICRCLSIGCPKRETCLRYTDRPEGERMSFTSRMCFFSEGANNFDYYIPVVENGD